MVTRFDNAEALVKKLEDLSKNGTYLFRGMTDADKRFRLVPKAFRAKEIMEYASRFPHSEAEIQKWFAKIIKDVKNDPNRALGSTPPYFLMRICRLLMAILQYNHAIYDKYHEAAFPKNLDDQRLIEIFKFGSAGHWAKEKTFFDYFWRFYIPFVPLCSLDGKPIKESFVFEDVTGLDESYPQHYDMPTSALDWTSDPFIALFFTIYSDASANNSKYLSISAYKEIIKEGSPVIIKDKDNLKDNPRATAQKGTFSYFSRPCSFYLMNGDFPSVEDYEKNFKNSGKFFELEKLVLPRNCKNINSIRKVLAERGIDHVSLLLPKLDGGI